MCKAYYAGKDLLWFHSPSPPSIPKQKIIRTKWYAGITQKSWLVLSLFFVYEEIFASAKMFGFTIVFSFSTCFE